ncbi:MAG: hypothetical protein ACK4VI_03235 [Alphaproteobacteria bacterium]
MRYSNAFLLAAFMAFALIGFGAQKALAQNVILEHFPSFGCMDTKVSEEFFHSLIGKEDDVLILACYTPNEGIVPDLSHQICSRRKMRYVVHNFPNASATPMVQFNGQYNANGSFPNVITSGIQMARAEDTIIQIPVRIEDASIIADLPEIQHHTPLELWFIAYNQHEQHVIENTAMETPELPIDADISDDERLLYEQAIEEQQSQFGSHDFYNIVKKVELLGPWEGRGETITIPLNNFRADGFVILAQERNVQNIIGSGWIKPGEHNFGVVTD